MDDQHSRLSELNNEILYAQNLISSLSISHPLRVPCVRTLANARFGRFKLSRLQEDLDQSIVGLTEAIFLPLPWHFLSQNIVQIFVILTARILIRAKEFKQPEGVKCCIIFLRYVQDQPPGVFPDLATALLVDALAVEVELELGDVGAKIEEIMSLCRKLLNSDVSTRSQDVVSFALRRVIHARFEKGERWEEQRIIQCVREANLRLPILHLALIAVAESLLERFKGTRSIDDYEEGTTILGEVVAFRAGDAPSPYWEMASFLVVQYAASRFYMSAKPDHLEEAIHRTRSFLDMISPEHPMHSSCSGILFTFQNMRGLDQVSFNPASNLESSGYPSFQELTTSLAQSNMDTFSETDYTNALMRTHHITDMSEIGDAIKYCRQLLASPLAGQLGDIVSLVFPPTLFRAFQCTKKIEYLNEAISIIRNNPSQGLRAHTIRVQGLTMFLTHRFELLNRREDLNELMQLFPIAVNDISATIPERFGEACHWARVARISRHPSTPIAYDNAISLMDATLKYSPTLHSQHVRLVSMREIYEELTLNYASYLVHRGQLEKAIEILERGRALMLSEMRGFRAPIDKIRTADSDLADKFAEVNRELEMVALTVSSSNDPDGEGGGIERMGPYGDLVARQQSLLDDREKLISQIQALPGFENFLTPPSFNTLRSAALHGPVIMINHCEWRSDILILLHDSPPSLIPTRHDFYGRASKLQDQLLGAREKGLESKEYEDALNSVLEKLYELVGRPVIKRFNELNIPEQSRVWWCPTSAFCSLPLHAMGPIPSDDGSKRYFMDLYIPSYIPSLSSLIESRKPASQTLDKPSILLVVQPDEYMPQALKEMKVVRAVNTQVTTLFSKRAKPTAVLKGLRDHRFAHIACHGTLEVGKPFDASFKLYAGERLTLLDIVRSQLPDAEFAYLSACHTAELTEGSLSDEGLHLTAAMQYCGFRSVVGTMWAMADVDGRDLARDFYRLVFEDQRDWVPYFERTAGALRDAVKRLRRRGGITSERWVNFVHYGA